MTTERRQALLAEINARVPPGVDWKQGAKDYLSALMRDQGAHNFHYHMIKPFIGGDDFRPFVDEMYRFVNIMALAQLTGKSRVLDVGCGPGWVCHYLGKLGLPVVGIDISQELLDIAVKRIQTDTLPAMGQFNVKFKLHDIETEPLEGEEPFDLAIFESVLHHFHDPLSVLDNVRRVMKDDGLIVIAEGVAPEPGSGPDVYYRSLMDNYRTLERPYTRAQIVEMLALTGFEHYRFFESVNGWHLQTPEVAAQVAERIRSSRDNNYVVASRSAARMEQLFGAAPRVAQPPPPLGRTLEHVAEFMAIPPEHFIAEAYRQVLGREPDPLGAAHYGTALREGRMDRVSVLARLAYSPEGRQRARQPRGLATAFAFSSLYRVPVLGAVARAIATALRLPPHLRGA